MRLTRATLLMLLCAVVSSACGKKGPPLPPLVRIPAPPADIAADRRGTAVDVRFTLPNANQDGSKPANIQRVEVYALNGAAPVSETEVLRAGARIGAVDVKAPRDPNQTVEEDDPDSDIDAPEGPGLDQGSVAHVRELLTTPVLATGDGVRTYVAIGITTRGRRGTMSKPAVVSLAAAPAAPRAPTLTYTETAVSVSWLANPGGDTESLAYHVYDVSPVVPAAAATSTGGAPPPAAGASAGGPSERRLSEAPLTVTTYSDARITWNVERCYAIRAVRKVGDLAVEGDPSERQCTVLKDTFPPAAPTGVTAVASEGAINLIWTPSPEGDVAGYRVLRAALPAGELEPVTPGTIKESSFTDSVQGGARYAYAVQAIDTAGNVSPASVRVEETAR